MPNATRRRSSHIATRLRARTHATERRARFQTASQNARHDDREAQDRNGEKSMVRIAVLGLSLIVVGVDTGWAQDIAGIEDCTKTSGLDKRTGCLQSNVNFLQRLVTKNARDARDKLDDAAS